MLRFCLPVVAFHQALLGLYWQVFQQARAVL
jgi:hypothetical protein